MNLETLLEQNRLIRAIGFDDAPFIRKSENPVQIAGVVCAGTRFEGMLWSEIQPDGWDATETITKVLLNSKFLPQLHIVLLDGISLGGFNIVDLPTLSNAIALPCVSVMRRYPKLEKVEYALKRLPDPERRLAMIARAGTIYEAHPFVFQVCGATPEITAKVLTRVTDRGHVPEPLRLAHLIASAVMKGESGKQA
ncbi:MAG: DUF99 family protein [Leptolyngbya sp. UWPOB_LEPTO1]|uniref:endonuclease dU n=1 Tax=Leptolyngbya sp. UWPOB_LEPTO1 TaxID=2815653 RepID=UPI001ACBE7A2|nr:DUF99 family protein [Leptolyngbya sp. UWPOB_LEPTO1]MBN8562740.1 DUF99 family protein [Leptolyngbya sp. UWPOB_LEPTO1]